MTNEDGQIAIVVNGEIYNHAELRADLEAKGHRFRSGSDSEVVVHLYEEVGARVPELLRGMFAFAVWDARAGDAAARARSLRRKAALLRRARRTASCSPPSSARCSPTSGRPAALSLPALDAYLALQYVPSPDTIYEGLKKLPAGHTLELRCGERPVVRRYYRPQLRADAGRSRRARRPRARVRATVEEAVRDAADVGRAAGRVPLGRHRLVDRRRLHGARDRARRSRRSRSASPRAGAADNELPYARLVAERYRTDHHELIVEPDMTGLLPTIVRHHGEPFADSSAVPTRYLCELTRRHVTVALSGDAGDEVVRRLPPLRLGARGRSSAPPARVRCRRRWPRALARRARRPGALAARVRRAPVAPTRRRATCASSVISRRREKADDLHARAARALRARRDRRGVRGAARAPAPPPTSSSRLQDLDCDTYLPDDILTKVDIASMSHGLEARAPFCDHDVVELGAALPGRLKLRRREGQAHPQAGVRRSGSARDHRAPQEGVRAADGALAGGAAARVRARAAALRPRRATRGLFAPAAVEALLDRHRAGEDHGERIWNLMVLETWFRELVDGRAAFVREAAAREAAMRGRLRPGGGGRCRRLERRDRRPPTLLA